MHGLHGVDERMFRKFLLLSAAFFLFIGCQEESSNSVLRVGTSPDYPPFEFKKDGEILGFDIDLATKIGSALGRKIQIIEFPFYKFTDALRGDVVDIVISSVTPSEERKELVAFSETYYNSSIAILFKPSHIKIESLQDLKNKIIGVQKGSTTESFLTDDSLADLALSILTHEDMSDVIYDLKVGEVEAVLLDLEEAIAFSNQHTEFNYTQIAESDDYGFAIALRKDDDALLEAVNDVLKELHESQWLEQLKMKWTHISAAQQ